MSDRPPSLRKETYADDILAKLEFIVAASNKLKVDALIQLGDMFHIKSPSRTSHRLVQRTMDVLQKSDAPVLLVVGNHDITNDSLNSIGSQPIGTLAKPNGIDLLMGPHPTLDVCGVPYLHDPHQSEEWLYDPRTLVCSHAAIFPNGDAPPYDHISAVEYADLMPDGVSAVAYGHIHNPHGMYKEGGVWFCNNGAISRGSLHTETINRSIQVTYYDSDLLPGNPYKTVKVPYKNPEEVFYTDMATHKMNTPITEDFMATMQNVSLVSVTQESIMHSAAEVLTPKQTHILESVLSETQ